MGGPHFAPGTALDWTTWGSRALPGAIERLDGYLDAVCLLVAAGGRVTEGMVDKAAEEVAAAIEEALTARG